VSPFDKVRALESVLAERDASKHEVGMLRELMEKGARGWDTQDRQQWGEREQDGGFANGGRTSSSSSRRNDSRKNDRSGRVRRKMKRRKGGDSESILEDRGRPSRRVYE